MVDSLAGASGYHFVSDLIVRTFLFCLIGVFLSPVAQAQELTGLFPLGGCRGTTIDVSVVGAAKPQAWVASHPGITAKIAGENRFAVTIADDVPAGDYDVWIVTAAGLTNPRRFAVGQWPDVVETETPQRNDWPQSAQAVIIPATVHGGIDPATDRDCFRFKLDEGQRLTVRCRSATLEGTVAPALTLFDPTGREVRHDSGHLAEAVIDHRAARSGEYVLQVEDRAFRRDASSQYRLELFTGPRLVAAFPTVLTRGKTQPVTLYGYDLPVGKLAGESYPKEMQTLSIDIAAPETGAADGGGWTLTNAAILDGFRYRHPSAEDSVRFGLVDHAVILETDSPHTTRQTAQPVTIPFEVAGQFSTSSDVAWYRFSAKAGTTFWVEAVGERGDAAMDLELAIHDSAGKAEVFGDTAHAKEFPPEVPLDSLDPSGVWKPASDGIYTLAIRNLYGSIAAGAVPAYRVSLGLRREEVCVVAVPLKMDKPTGLSVVAGKSAEWSLVAIRRGGHEKPIRIRAENLPPGLEMKDTVIEEKKFTAKLTLTAAADAVASAGLITLRAETEIDGKLQSVPVRGATYVTQVKPTRVRLTDGIAAAVLSPSE